MPAISGILQPLLQPNRSPDSPRVFFYPGDITELPHYGLARRFRTHAARDVLVRLVLDVLSNFLVKKILPPLAVGSGIHDPLSSGAGLRIRPIARASLSHFVVSTSSCFRPFEVNR